MGATVVLACRSRERGEEALRYIRRRTGNDDVELLTVDLLRQGSVRDFAETLTATFPRVHVLVNNAGIFAGRRRLAEDGIESTFAVNHLSHFLLTNLLLDSLRRSAPSRIVNVSSEASRSGTIDFANLNGERRWSAWRAYAQSKLANVLFTVELARRLDGTGVTANSVHPGGVRTNLGRPGAGWVRVGMWLARPFLLSPAQGADTVLYLASSPEVESIGGKYYIRRRPAEPHPSAHDTSIARRLWEVSESLAGLRPSAGSTPS